MPSLEESIRQLGDDLAARPMRIAAYSDMPFAIFRYAPQDEFALRKQLRLLTISLGQKGRQVKFVSLGRVVWETARECGGVDYLFKTEVQRGFDAAQKHLNRILTAPDFRPAADSVLAAMEGLDPEHDVVFLVRAGAFAPHIYRSSLLLDSLHHRTRVPVVLFYPGSAEIGTDLRFYDLPTTGNLGTYNYRVKVYGV